LSLASHTNCMSWGVTSALGVTIIHMVLHHGIKQHTVRALLDTGCSVPLINQKAAVKLQIPLRKHENKRVIENFEGKMVHDAGSHYTDLITLQHHRHYSQESFEVSPMEVEIDIFLPFWWIERHPPQGAWRDPKIRFNIQSCLEKCTKHEVADFALTWDESILREPDTRVIGYVAMVQAGKETANPLYRVSEEFREYLGVMSRETAEALPEHKRYDCRIELKKGGVAPWGPIYHLSEKELEALREWLKEMLKNGKIRPCTSPASCPILFVPKPNGRALRLCVDYRGLNRITIPNRYPLPLIQELQDRVQGAQWFTKMDLKNGFNLIRIREGDEWKTTFRTRYGLYEFQVMPFGLTNAPSTFQDMMNHIFSDMLDLTLIAYMDDILIYTKTRAEHDQRVRETLRILQENGLAVAADKCVWRTTEVEFLGYILSREGVKMVQEKVQAVLDWKTPASLTEVQSFLGFANFYQRFIQDYSRVARPLTELTKKTEKWAWNQ